MSDAIALDWLDRLLDLQVDARSALLQQLSTEEPALHARLVRLLDAALTVEGSQVLAHAVREGLLAVTSPPGAISLQANQPVAGYQLLRELGRGGMAAVWLAERLDGVIKRQVAMKLPLFAVGSPVAIARFLQEKDVLAALTHRHIARLYDAGVVEGQPFIVLEYVDGVPITEYCDRNALDVPARLRLFLQVLEAVDYAHKRLVVHRDLKPSNILVDAEGQVKLLDFGISKLLVDPVVSTRAVDLTQLGDAVLTPAYAAPEQVNAGPISTSTDVFVLGVVLHQLLSGLLPYANLCGNTPALGSMIDALLRGSPTLPSQAATDDAMARARGAASVARLRAILKGDLDTITHKALQYEPARRYGSAERLADDLRRFLASRPIAARNPGHLYSLGLFLRRNRAVSVAACLGGVLSLIGATTAVQQYLDRRASADRTVAAVASRDFMFDFANGAELNDSQTAAQITGRQMLDAAVERARQDLLNKPDLRGEVLADLGWKYMLFLEPDIAEQIVREAIEILEGSVAPRSAVLNNARAQLSAILIRENKLAEAKAVATLAIDSCSRGAACAQVRYFAQLVLSNIYRYEGRNELSLQAFRQATEEAETVFGGRPEMIDALNMLAMAQRNAGGLVEADRTMQRALRLSASHTLPEADRIRLWRSMAVIDIDLGRYTTALERLRQCVSKTEHRSERALLYRLLASAHLAMGEPAAALQNVKTAIDLEESRHSGVNLLSAMQVQAQALALLGDKVHAAAQIESVIDGLQQSGRSPQSLELMRARRVRGEILLRNGQPAEALRELAALREHILALSEQRPLELGLTLDLLGCAQREVGLLQQARASHAAAAVQLTVNLPADHPFSMRNALYRVAAGDDTQRVVSRAVRFKLTLTPTSIWRQIIELHDDPSACGAAKTGVCTLVL